MNAVELLSALPLFQGLPEAAREAAAQGESRDYPVGAAVFSPRESFPALGVVVSGRLEVTRGIMRMDTLRTGDLFGAAALFGRRRYPTTLTAAEPSRVFLLPQAVMEDLMTRWPALALRYISYLSQRLAFLSDRLDALGAGKGADKLLCYLRDKGGRVSGLSGEKLAATLGLSRATLYRAMDELETRGLITRKGMNLRLVQNTQER